MRDFDIISLDLETSGTEVHKHTILSIGCVRMSDLTSFYADVQHDSLEIAPAAMRVNQIETRFIDGDDRLTLEQVDEKFSEWLKSDPYYREGKKYALIPMGMNVGTFDMKFVRMYLPKSSALFGYRSIDLNALIFTDALMHDQDFKHAKHAAKVLGTSYAQEHTDGLAPHHALYDAYSNVGVFNFLMNVEFKGATVGEVVWEGGKPYNA